jgi:K+/H+ antiporter YhaU regulatory subunit KhtT
MRDGVLIPNPKSVTVFQIRDRVGLIGEQQQVDEVAELIRPSTEDRATARDTV